MKRPRSLLNDRGGYLPMVAASLLMLLLIAGYAVDSGTLYNAQLAAQKVADGGAIVGGYQLVRRKVRFSDTTFDNEIRAFVVAHIQANLRLLGYSPERQNLSVENVIIFREDTGFAGYKAIFVDTKVELDTPLLLLGFIPGMERSRIVSASARSEIPPASVHLILDASASMSCPKNGSCDCLPDDCDPANSKFELLRDATAELLKHFDEERDIIGVTAFQDRAFPVRLPNPAGGFNSVAINNALAAVTPGNTTNICDALATGYEAFEIVRKEHPELDTSYVFFSDGAPTATRLTFASPKPMDPVLLPPGISSRGPYDYFVWAVNQVYEKGGLYCEFLSPLHAAQEYGNDCDQPFLCPGRVACSNASAKLHIDPSPARCLPDDGGLSIGGCFTNMQFYVPGEYAERGAAATKWPMNVTDDPADSTKDTKRYRERFMDCAIAHADFMRSRRGIFYTVGLGADSGVNPNADPYQNVYNELTRKDNFMERVALQYKEGQDFPGYTPWATLLADRSYHVPGAHYATSDATSLPKHFVDIARRIKLRLVQ